MPGAPQIPYHKAAAADALAQYGFSTPEIAAKTDISQRTVYDIINRHGRWGEVAEKPVFARLRAEQNQHLEASFRLAAAKSLALAFDPVKLEKASYYQLIVGSSIALDKSRLLAGEPTEITATINLHAIQGLDRLATILSHTLLPQSNDVPRETIEINPQGNQAVKT